MRHVIVEPERGVASQRLSVSSAPPHSCSDAKTSTDGVAKPRTLDARLASSNNNVCFQFIVIDSIMSCKRTIL